MSTRPDPRSSAVHSFADDLAPSQTRHYVGLSRAFGGGKHSENNGGITSTSSGGVMGGPQRKKAPGSKFWDDEVSSSPYGLLERR